MGQEIPTYQNTEQPIQTPSPVPSSSNDIPKENHSPVSNGTGKGVLFEIVFVAIFLVILFGILNYFNILRLSEIFPQLGFLPRREVPTGTSQESNNLTIVPTISPNEQAKQTLLNLLSTVIAPSLLPKSISDIKLIPNKEAKEKFNGSWVTKEGVAGVNFDISSDSNKITSLKFRFQKIQPTSPSPELAKSTTTELFYVNPKGTWLCTQIATGTSYCENFWEEQSKDVKTGLGFQINSLSDTSARFIFSFCEHSKESNLYSWKSCRAEFAGSGVQ